ncbi:glycosyltransferase family 2 protein [Cohnella massiliensis]|uniref:glycosyltransferase family 2 protein n=1 Tax=Cohnella massiliensis TaxID=1816691 RepID=UPI0009BA06B6|nr:glycosyltransferase family 2 protein [Cohnella massiliensis]
MNSVSLVMIVRDEEKVLSRCLDSAASIVDDIVVLDTGSTDGTKDIARKYGARVYDYTWNHHFAEARNASLDHSRTNWNLVLDADEYITNDCGRKIRDFMEEGPSIGRIRRLSSVQAEDGIQLVSDFISRLFPSNIRYKGRIHEQVSSGLPRKVVDVEAHHDGYLNISKAGRNIPLLEQQLSDHPNSAYYTFQLAKEYKGVGRHAEYLQWCRKAYNLLTKQEMYAPYVIVEYLYAMLKCGELEGGAHIIERESEYLHDFPDFHFVSALFYLDYVLQDVANRLPMLPRIEQAYFKCLELGDTTRYDSVIGTGSFSAMYNLGVFYEVQGRHEEAVKWYRQSAAYAYEPAQKRLRQYNLGTGN